MLSEDHIWNIITDHSKTVGLVAHQIHSYNNFLVHGIEEIVSSPLIVNENHTISFSNVHIPKPVVIEEDRSVNKLLPTPARNRDLAYDSPVYVTVTETIRESPESPFVTNINHRIPICRLPIMLRCVCCHLDNMKPDERVSAGECGYDNGGYFIIRGNERVLVSQLRSTHNICFVFEQQSDKYEFICEVRSMSEVTCHSVVIKTTIAHNNRTIDIFLPYIKDPVPIGVIFKALGFTKPEDFSNLIGLECPDMDRYIRYITRDSFCDDIACGCEYFKTIQDKNLDDWNLLSIDEQCSWEKEAVTEKALLYIGSRSIHPVKQSDILSYAKQIVNTELFPHMGINASNKAKALFVGHMVHKLLCTKLGMRTVDDRDDYANKRVESPGILCHELFGQLFKKFKETIANALEKKKHTNVDIIPLINRNTTITIGFRHCFATGNWGVPKTSYIRAGVSQILSRLSYGATLSHMRRVCIPIGKEAKNTKIRQINPSQIMFICPCETPEGQPVGIVLNLSLMTKISSNTPTYLVRHIVENCKEFTKLDDDLANNTTTKVFVNGMLIGFSPDVYDFIDELKIKRTNKVFNYDVSIGYDDVDDEVRIATDGGRLLRPVFVLKDSKLLIKESDGTNWDNLVEKGLVRYIDNAEVDNAVIAFGEQELDKYHNDYCEIAPAMMLGVMGSIIPWPDHSQSPRNCYQTSMGKQAMSMYAMSFQNRTDTVSHVIGYPQRPLVSTRMSKLMGFDEMPSGINAIVAIACYTGFNQEDSIIMSQGAVQRGLFTATSYRTHTDQEKKHSVFSFEKIGCPPLDKRKMDVNYGLLGPDGIIMKRFPKGGAVYVEKGDVLIGKTFIDSAKGQNEVMSDCSLVVKKGEEGFIDRIDITITPDGHKLVKIVIRTERVPEVGDKFASRAAQKGTCGMVYRQEDMPWTADGMCPDIIINPHCIPSRMTINQLLESVLGKTCAVNGTFGDATPFTSASTNIANDLCDHLGMTKFNGKGTEMLYNGFTGEPMGEVFMGPVYYQRLKHLVSEKIHARATGPVTTLTRQPLEGRSRDGGLRFGEMERDCMISHGTSMFLKERLCDQSDPYQAPICESCGNISTTTTKCGACGFDDVSMVGMPYVTKLVLQELNAMCIKTKIGVA
jgi:DNA-directed RNA polymerase II subunit RPB2